MLSSAELARVSIYLQQSQIACCVAIPGSLRARTRFKQSCVVACRFRVSCTLYPQFPCAASCLCTCKNMQCNVPEGICWRLQTPKFAPPIYACEPIPGTRTMRQSYQDHLQYDLGRQQKASPIDVHVLLERNAQILAHNNRHSHFVCRYIHSSRNGSNPYDGTDLLVTSDAEEATNETSNAIQQHSGQ